ncbi:MAG TPA: hypothetical protein VHS59_11775 [Bacillota bacterium]|nr:hypothetical protein [Bacillota bacterium]
MVQNRRDIDEILKEARIFAERHHSSLIFWLLQRFMRCDDYQLDYVIKKIYCMSNPISQSTVESKIKTYLGVLLLPVSFLKKQLRWKSEAKVDYLLETIDADYFYGRFATIYDSLQGTKRITPRVKDSFPREDATDSVYASVYIWTLFSLFLTGILSIIPLYIFCLVNRVNILREYRVALSTYAAFDGYFRRYPCENFVTYADDTNHPSRYIAFRQQCNGSMIVIQNGERGRQPVWAFGMVDQYFVFGQAYVRMLEELGYHMEQACPVGSLALNQRYSELSACDKQPRFDILYIDNGSLCPPYYGGLKQDVAESERTNLAFLNQYKAMHRDLKIAYQLRPYNDNPEVKGVLLNILQGIFTEDIELLENTGQGESYQNVSQANVVLTFQSTMGFEAMMLGKKVLFLNYSGYPNETLCEDKQFQIEEYPGDYEHFAATLDRLLTLELDSIPEIALLRHYVFDGAVQEKIAASIDIM